MRAKELWRFAPRLHMRTGPEPAAAVPRELMPPELEKKMRAAFERARAEHIEVQIPKEVAREAGDPWISTNSAAFLTLEGERRALAARLCRPYRRRCNRYRDLILITKLTRLEYEHLAGRVSRRAGPASLPDRSPALNGDMPADWAQPWGSGPMLEMRTTFVRYRNQHDRLARRLSAPTMARATADAERHRMRIWSRFERAMSEWTLELEHERAWSPEPEKLAAQPWGNLRFSRAAVVATLAVAAAGVGVLVAGTHIRGPSDSPSAPSGAIASVPGLPLAALGHISRESRPAQARGAGQRAHHRSTAHEQTQSDTGAVASVAPQAAGQTVLTASDVPPATPPPAPAAAPPPSAAPAAQPQPASQPQPAPNPKPSPVHSLPPPVHSLPKPGGGGG
jgi:hypothetical protein